MTLDEARRIVTSTKAEFSQVTEAAAVIASSTDATREDFLACLKSGGLPAEFAALALYRRTGRPITGNDPQTISTSHRDWVEYLKEHGELTVPAIGR